MSKFNFTNNTPNNKFEINGRTPERGDVAFEIAAMRVHVIDSALDLANNNPSVTIARYNADVKARDAASTAQQQQINQVDLSQEIKNEAPAETFTIQSKLEQLRASAERIAK